jgi:hypothetical protein
MDRSVAVIAVQLNRCSNLSNCGAHAAAAAAAEAVRTSILSESHRTCRLVNENVEENVD